jgi:hypothetical protein
VNRAVSKIALVVMVAELAGGAFLLPRTETIAQSKRGSFGEAKADFDRIVPGGTSVSELGVLGFDPATNPNVRILTYLDAVERFMPKQSITKEDLDQAVRRFIGARELGQA